MREKILLKKCREATQIKSLSKERKLKRQLEILKQKIASKCESKSKELEDGNQREKRKTGMVIVDTREFKVIK